MAQTRKKYYGGVRDAAWKILRDEGPRGFYRGIGVSLWCTCPSIAINFTAFDEFKWLFAKLGIRPDSYVHTFLAGACAGITASTIMFPADLLRRQMQMVGVGGRPLVYTNVWQAVRMIFMTGFHRQEGGVSWLLGFREFFRGLMPELLKVAPHSAIMFTTQNQLISRQWFGEDALLADCS
ncbi:mcfB [Symbiodinium sp. CCMP2592]|nr:mcfB [Symbiodinium sp. CCMP2592]